MTLSLTTRSGKGSPLTHGEVDQNWTDIQTDVNTIKSDLLGGFKNKIINGNFDFWQRGTSTTSSVYLADRWIVSIASSGSSGTVSRQNFTFGQTDVPGHPSYFLRSDRTVASSVIGNIVNQYIEDVRTFSGEMVTLSFWAKISSGTKVFSSALVQYFGTGGSPSSDVSYISDTFTLTTSWQKITRTFTLANLSGKTLGTNNNSYLRVIPIREEVSPTTFTVDLAQVQLEKGSEATDFEVRPSQVELALCQRYYEKSYNIDVNPGTIIGSGSSSYIPPISAISMFGLNRPFKVTKRSIPTMTAYSTATGDSGKMRNDTDAVDVTVSSFVSTSQSSTGHPQLSAAVLEKIITGQWTADAEL